MDEKTRRAELLRTRKEAYEQDNIRGLLEAELKVSEFSFPEKRIARDLSGVDYIDSCIPAGDRLYIVDPEEDPFYVRDTKNPEIRDDLTFLKLTGPFVQWRGFTSDRDHPRRNYFLYSTCGCTIDSGLRRAESLIENGTLFAVMMDIDGCGNSWLDRRGERNMPLSDFEHYIQMPTHERVQRVTNSFYCYRLESLRGPLHPVIAEIAEAGLFSNKRTSLATHPDYQGKCFIIPAMRSRETINFLQGKLSSADLYKKFFGCNPSETKEAKSDKGEKK